MIDPVQKLAALRAMAEAATDEVLADFLLSPGSGRSLDFVIIGSNPTTIGIDFAADPAIYDLPDGDGLRLFDAAAVWTANAGIGAPILTREELVAEMCRLYGPPPTVIEAIAPRLYLGIPYVGDDNAGR